MIDAEVDEEDRRKEAQAHKKHLSALLESEGWRIVTQVIEQQVQARHNLVMLTPLGHQNAVYEQEFTKGEASGLQLVVKLVTSLLENAEALSEALKDTDNDNAEPTEPADVGDDPYFD